MTDTGTDTDVLVVGAGPTGLTLAIELRRRGVDCRLVERNDSTVTTSRALSINPRTLQAFEDMGVLDPVLTEGVRIGKQTMYADGRELFGLDLDTVDASPYPFAWFLPQNRTERILADRLVELGGEVEFEHELVGFGGDDGSVTAVVEHVDGSGRTETITARWLVGTDGSRSRVRRTLGLEMEGETLPGAWLAADADLDWDHPTDEVVSWLHGEGVFAALPMSRDGPWRLFAESRVGDDEALPELSRETFQRLLRERTGDRTTTVGEPTWTSALRVNQRMVRRYRQGRVFLAGDAAHVHSPLGGLGMNTGIQDAYNLGWKLAAVVEGTAHEGLLDTYEAERLPVAREVLEATGVSSELLLGLVDPAPAVRLLRDVVLPRLLNAERVQARFLRGDTQLDVAYRGSPLSAVNVESALGELEGARSGRSVLSRMRRSWHAPRAGDRAPDGRCRRPDGPATTLYEQLHGRTGFALLLFAGHGLYDSTRDVDRLLEIARRVPVDVVDAYPVIPDGRAPPDVDGDVTVLVDGGELHGRYDATRPSLYLLRPDDHVGFRGSPARLAPLLAYLGEWFGPAAPDPEAGAREPERTNGEGALAGTGPSITHVSDAH